MTTKNLANPLLVTSIREAIRNTAPLPIFGIACLSLIYLLDINQILFIQFNQISELTGALLWANLTLLGDPIILLCVALSLHAAVPSVSFAILPTMLIGGSSVFFFKWFFAVVRPPGVLQDIIVIGQAPISGAFPSGHTTGVFALATLLILLIPNRHIKVAIFLFALLIGLSRIAVGVHWPLDVSSGIILGWISAILGFHLSKDWKNTIKITVFINTLLASSALYLIFRNTGLPQADILRLTIAFFALIAASVSLIKLKSTISKS